MKKGILSLCCIAALSTSSFAADDVMKQLELLKAQIAQLEAQIKAQNMKNMKLEDGLKQQEEKIVTVENKVAKTNDKVNEVRAHDAGDNIKWDVDFRTQLDNIQYKHASGKKSENDALMTNRLWLNMAFQADENSIFQGTLAYNKAYGDTANHSQSNTQPGYANFDWVTNENALDNTLKVKEAYWLYKEDNAQVPWAVSIGRRPSTDGLGINARVDQERKSPLSHTVNVEFDGASAKFDLDKITGVPGMWWKFCAGRGLTNAKPRFQSDGADYAEDDTKNSNVDMFGFIFVPYDDGQYSIHTNYARAWNLIGFDQTSINSYGAAYQTYAGTPNATNLAALNYAAPAFKDVGNMDLATIMFKTEGIGNGISDYLDDTTFFASAAMTKTLPNSLGMLGTTESQTGHSFWLGLNAPCPLNMDDARVGIEWNKGSKYWRSMTYGEDTMAGSKIATRGQAWEVYRNADITDALSWHLSYTYMQYDYTGSNAFFGAEGKPMSMAEALAANQDPVKEAQNISAYIKYRF